MKSKISMMLRHFLPLTFLFLFTFLIQLSAQTADVKQGCAPLTVKFTNKPGLAKPYWDFGNTVNSELADPINLYSKPGEYSVELRDGGPAGTLMGTIKISVFAQPTLGFKGAPLSGCTPLEVPFSADVTKNNAITIVGYRWLFGDSGRDTTANPKHTYLTPGKFTVSLEIKTNFATCDVTRIFRDTVKTVASPLVVYTTNPEELTACVAPLAVNFINGSEPRDATMTFNWDFGNGIKFNGVNPSPQNYAKDGFYRATLTGTSVNGCKSTFTKVISVGKPRAAFLFPNDTLCLDAEYQPTNLSAFGNYQWDFGSDSKVNDPTLASPKVSWSKPGLKTIKLKVLESSGKCSNDTTAVVYVEDKVSTFKTTHVNPCQSPSLVTYETNQKFSSYSWTFSTQDMQTSALPKPSILWKNTDPSGYSQIGRLTANARLTTVSYAGCEGSYELNDTFFFANARTVPNKWQGCAPLTVEFADSSFSKEKINTYTFLWADGSAPETFTNRATRTHTFQNPGEYKVRMVITNSRGCIDTSHVVLIEVGSKITPDFSVDKTTICPGDTVTFKDISNNPKIDGWHYSTDANSSSSHCFGDSGLKWVYKNAGQQSVTLTVVYNGCYNSIVKNNLITVKGPVAKMDYLVQCAPLNREVIFKNISQDATKITWDFGDTTSSNANDITHVYKRSGNFKVKLTAENSLSGCKASIDSATIHVRDLKAGMQVLKEDSRLPAGFKLCIGENYLLKNNSKDADISCFSGVTWYFSDPNERPITTDNETTTFAPLVPGDYKLRIIAQDINGCKDTLDENHRVYSVTPIVTFTPKEICIPAGVLFDGTGTKSDTTIKEWKWTFGDGQEGMEVGKVSHNYITPPLTPGKYNVKLKLTDNAGCGGEWNDTISVYAPVSFISARTPICLGDNINVKATDYTAKGNKLSFSWSIDGKDAGTNQEFKHLFTTEGKKTIKVNFIESNTNCPGTNSYFVEVQTKPTVDFELPTGSLCVPRILDFTNKTSSKYALAPFAWDFGNGQVSSDANGTAAYDKKGTYKITLFAETTGGCKASTQKSVTLAEKPIGDFTMSKSQICLGESITFTLKDTAKVGSFQWFFGDGTDLSNQNPTTHAYTSRNLLTQNITTASLKLTSIGGACTNTVDKIVIINKVIADFDILNNGVCALDTIKFINKSVNATQYTWDYGDSKSDTVSSHSYKKGTAYTVKLSVLNSSNGCKDEVSKAITLIEPTLGDNIKIPSIFTPESQNKDDREFTYFAQPNTGGNCVQPKEVKSFQIFNRWGTKVFDSADNTTLRAWNGKKDNSGSDMASDVYMYIFYFTDGSSQPGNVTLIR
ncbi:MAG: PKD domain-containing protein [Saprospiraceae bacterium]